MQIEPLRSMSSSVERVSPFFFKLRNFSLKDYHVTIGSITVFCPFRSFLVVAIIRDSQSSENQIHVLYAPDSLSVLLTSFVFKVDDDGFIRNYLTIFHF